MLFTSILKTILLSKILIAIKVLATNKIIGIKDDNKLKKKFIKPKMQKLSKSKTMLRSKNYQKMRTDLKKSYIES